MNEPLFEDPALEADVRRAAQRSPIEDLSTRFVPGPLTSGQQLGKYQLLAPLGKPGGMGEVWRAVDTATGRVCAIKVMRPDLVSDEHFKRFVRECWASVKLVKDENLVLAIDEGNESGRPYLVLELLDGATFAEVLTRHGSLAVGDACALLFGACCGLHAAHDKGIIHRDFKLSNVLLTRDGRVKVLDLGLARCVDGEELTWQGEILGTADYIAPEQIADARRADVRSDLYSVGIALYKLLTGCGPFDIDSWLAKGARINALLLAHEATPPKPILSLRADVPDDLAKIVDGLLAKDPAKRGFTSAADLARTLLPFAETSDVGALAAKVCTPATKPLLEGRLDILLWDQARGCLRPLANTDLPLDQKTQFKVEARLDQPAYLYLLWIDTDGEVSPSHGWLPRTWTPDPKARPTTMASLGAAGWTLTGPRGLETAVLLARPTPLTEDLDPEVARWADRLRQTAGLLPPEEPRIYPYPAPTEPTSSPWKRPGEARDRNPVFTLHSFLGEVLGQKYFGLVRALSFANRGE